MTQRAKKLGWIGLTLLCLLCGCAGNKKKGPQREILSQDQETRLLEAVDPIQKQVDEGQTAAARAGFKQLKTDFPGIARFDLKSFSKAELALSKAAKYYKQLVKKYPDSALYNLSISRIFSIGKYYLDGPLVVDFLFLKVRGYARGVKLMELVSDELGIDDANGLGVQAEVLAAQNLQERRKYDDAYLKWLEISTAWDSGPYAQQSLLGMAQCKYDSYQLEPVKRRPLFDTSRLEEARTYYRRYISLYPKQAETLKLDQVVKDIEEQLALKQLTIAQFYQRTGEATAARLYYKRVVQDWPQTKAAQDAREQLDQTPSKDHS